MVCICTSICARIGPPRSAPRRPCRGAAQPRTVPVLPPPPRAEAGFTPSLSLLPPRRCWRDRNTSQTRCLRKNTHPLELGVRFPLGVYLRWPFAPSLPSRHPGCFAVDGCGQRGIQRCWLCSARRGTSQYWTGLNIPGTWQKQAAALKCPHNAASGDSQNKPKIVRRVEPSTA